MKKMSITPVYFKNKQGFSLIELIIVIIVVGVIAAFSVAGFFSARKRPLENEAKATLKLIQAAQQVHFLETNSYVNCLGAWDSDQETCINTNLRLSIPPGGPSDDVDWDFETYGTDGCTHCRNRSTDARMHVCIGDGDVSTGNCSCP